LPFDFDLEGKYKLQFLFHQIYLEISFIKYFPLFLPSIKYIGMFKIYKVTQVVELILANRRVSKKAEIRELATESNLYEKVNLIMAKGANGSPELLDEIIAVLQAENAKAVKYLQEKKKATA
jgi:hypothetical protein